MSSEYDTDMKKEEIQQDVGVTFVLEIRNGTPFKNMIDGFKQVANNMVFSFSKKEIYGSQYVEDLGILIGFRFSSHLLNKNMGINSESLNYTYNSSCEEFKCCLNLEQIKSKLMQISGRDGIRIYKESNDPLIYFKRIPYKQVDTNSDSVSYMSIMHMSKIEIYSSPTFDPDLKTDIFVESKSFKAELTPIVKSKQAKVSIEGSSDEIKFIGTGDANSPGAIVVFYKRKDGIKLLGLESLGLVKRQEAPFTVYSQVPNKIVKLLAKLNGNSTPTKSKNENRQVKISIQKDYPIAIESDIGDYGYANVYITQTVKQ